MELATLYCVTNPQHDMLGSGGPWLSCGGSLSHPDARQGVRCHWLFLGIWVPDTFEAPLLTLPGKCETFPPLL